MRYVLSLVCVLYSFLGFSPAYALDAPTGPVLLTVQGNISHSNTEQGAQFDRAMLQALEWREVETYSPYTNGPQRFSGPTFVAVLEAVGADGSVIQAVALDDYKAQINLTDAIEHNAILAMESGGRPLTVRHKGPVRVIFPLTEAQAQEKLFFVEMVWQLKSLEILP